MTVEDVLVARASKNFDGAITPEGLAGLQRAWCYAQPFHNLDLLAGVQQGTPPLDQRQAVARCAARLGGPCHVQSWGFLVLLRRLGFEAHLVGATITQPGDHLLICVRFPHGDFLCDVGNGQPYLHPFPSNQGLEQQHLGWHVRSEPDGPLIVVHRRSPDQPAWRCVYRASLEEKSWDDFAEIIERHHRQPGFGPFMTGLRAVRIGSSSMTTLRDDVLTTYTNEGFSRRVLLDGELQGILEANMGLGELPVGDALEAFRARRREAS